MNSDMDLVREAFHYRSRFAGSTLVFKIDFPVTCEPAFPSMAKDLALLAQNGFRVVIVPGAKEWIDSVLQENSIATRYVPSPDYGSIRITGAKAMPFVEMAAFHVATRFMTSLSASRCDSVVGNFVRARGLGVLDGIDMEYTGKVEKIRIKPIGKILDSGMVSILPSIGWSSSGKPYNVPSDEIALAASGALGAVKLFIISSGKNLESLRLPQNTETPIKTGKQNTQKGRSMRLTPKEAETILELNRVIEKTPAGKTGEPEYNPAAKGVSELKLAIAAIKAGVERVHIIDGREEGAILGELFSNLGAGVMVYADEYEAIRPLETQDIPDVLRIMEPLMSQGILVRRSAESIQEKKEDYWVYGIDGQAHASGALHLWGEQGEIAAIAVDNAYTDMKLGSRIVRFLINKAAKEGLRRVFVFTTQTQDWFENLGFKESTIESLPEERRKSYNPERKSKVYSLEIK